MSRVGSKGPKTHRLLTFTTGRADIYVKGWLKGTEDYQANYIHYMYVDWEAIASIKHVSTKNASSIQITLSICMLK